MLFIVSQFQTIRFIQMMSLHLGYIFRWAIQGLMARLFQYLTCRFTNRISRNAAFWPQRVASLCPCYILDQSEDPLLNKFVQQFCIIVQNADELVEPWPSMRFFFFFVTAKVLSTTVDNSLVVMLAAFRRHLTCDSRRARGAFI